ncbi:hypothetical protein UPYG_G00156180 [Umbra pygmaea]|uniref:Extracellular matrix protein 1 n=1 Tax=Umbra pygmaea TaxID=75934 RepID=A0ABD0WZH1_UMBPY
MFWTRTLLFVLVCASAAFEDMGQRPDTFDLDDVVQEPSQMNPVLQRSLELWEMLDRKELAELFKSLPASHPESLKDPLLRGNSSIADSDMTHREVTFVLNPEFPTRGRPMAGPRSLVTSNPSVVFPPGQPTPDNLQAICLHSSRRPRYPASFYPSSGFDHHWHQGDAVNRIESWYSTCCHGNWTQKVDLMLCCVRQAWDQSISTFCEVEFSVKTSHYFCCLKEEDRDLCFNEAAPNPTYMPITEETGSTPDPKPDITFDTVPGFTFDPNTCYSPPRSQAVPRGVRENLQVAPRDSDISFSPGRPTSQNIRLVCRLVNHRRFYIRKCLPRTGYRWLARQSKEVKRLEGGFRRCCKGQEDVLACADKRWREVIDRFCDQEKTTRALKSSCCNAGEGEQRYNCFSNSAPNPAYDKELHYSSDAQNPSLGHICETQKYIKEKFLFFPLQTIVGLCCTQPTEQRTSCVKEQLVMHADIWCSVERNPPSTVAPQCCLRSSKDRPKCFSDQLIKNIAKAKKSPLFRTCPLS